MLSPILFSSQQKQQPTSAPRNQTKVTVSDPKVPAPETTSVPQTPEVPAATSLPVPCAKPKPITTPEPAGEGLPIKRSEKKTVTPPKIDPDTVYSVC